MNYYNIIKMAVGTPRRNSRRTTKKNARTKSLARGNQETTAATEMPCREIFSALAILSS